MPAWPGQEENSLQSSLALASSRGLPPLQAEELPLSWALVPVWLCGAFRTYAHPTGPFRVIIPKKILCLKKKSEN